MVGDRIQLQSTVLNRMHGLHTRAHTHTHTYTHPQCQEICESLLRPPRHRCYAVQCYAVLGEIPFSPLQGLFLFIPFLLSTYGSDLGF